MAMDSTPEPLQSLNKARVILGKLKDCKAISYATIVRLVQEEGLPKVNNPFSPGTWAFQESAILAWFQDYTQRDQMKTPGKRGRPRKTA